MSLAKPPKIGRPKNSEKLDRLCGERIAKARLDAGLNQSQFARALGVSRRTVLYWEGGDNGNLTRYRLLAIAKLLKCTVGWLAAGEGQ